MARAAYASLLDDPSFLADLEQVEVSGPPAIERPTSRWFVESPERAAAPRRVVRRPPSLAAPSPASIAGVAARVAGFLMMMGLGGAAAAYVFADRVALILGP